MRERKEHAIGNTSFKLRLQNFLKLHLFFCKCFQRQTSLFSTTSLWHKVGMTRNLEQ